MPIDQKLVRGMSSTPMDASDWKLALREHSDFLDSKQSVLLIHSQWFHDAEHESELLHRAITNLLDSLLL